MSDATEHIAILIHGLFPSVRAALGALSGYVLIWIAIGGACGFAVRAPHTEAASCTPFNSIFGLIESRCGNDAVNLFWDLLVGWPRLAIIPPALAVAQFKAALLNGVARDATEGGVWLAVSLPLAFVVWKGSGYWRQRNSPILAALALVIVTEAFALGFLE